MRGTFDEVNRDRRRRSEADRKAAIKTTKREIKVTKKLVDNGRDDLAAYLRGLERNLKNLGG